MICKKNHRYDNIEWVPEMTFIFMSYKCDVRMELALGLLRTVENIVTEIITVSEHYSINYYKTIAFLLFILFASRSSIGMKPRRIISLPNGRFK